MKTKELCIKLAKAENEKDVISILKEVNYWDNESLWRNFGDNENNYSTIGNQSANADAALVEKLINSVDAMLMGAALKNGENPESNTAPTSMPKAVDKYFNVKDGRLTYLDARERSRLAENIYLVATGGKTNPCYSIIDKGEGISPLDLPNTILSISKSNKLRVPFVQGKFHMGGTGALPFCGKNNLQLIISKRNPAITLNEEELYKDEWSFTIIRRFTPKGVRNSVYKYLAPIQLDNKKTVLHFKANELSLLPGVYPEAYTNPLEYGTFVKLYEYELRRYKTTLTLDPYYRLSVLLPGIALPIRLAERRKGYSAHSYESTLSGLKVRLEEDRGDVVESGFPTSHEISIMGEKITTMIYVFKKGKSKNYRKSEGIIFTVNGQTHGHIPDQFFSRKNVSMGYLQDSILVICDCSAFTNLARENLFMNSRDRLRQDNELHSAIIKEFESLINQHDGLRQLKNRRRQEEISDKLSDSKPLAALLSESLKHHPALSALLGQGKKLATPFNLEATVSGERDFNGEKHPSYFNLIKPKKQEELEKHCPINRKFRVQFDTDVVNDYFGRDDYPGKFLLKVNGIEIDNYDINLWNGIANLNVSLPSDVVEGEVLEYEAVVLDETIVNQFIDKFKIICTAAVIKNITTNSNGNRKQPPKKDGNDKESRKEPEQLGLPETFRVKKDEWDTHNFNEWSALRVVNNGESGFDFYINIHNTYLLNEIKSQPNKDAKLIETQFVNSLVLIGLALLQEWQKEESEAEINNIEEHIRDVSKAIAPVLVPIIDILGDIKIEE